MQYARTVYITKHMKEGIKKTYDNGPILCTKTRLYMFKKVRYKPLYSTD